MTTLKFACLFNWRDSVLLKIIAELLRLAICLFRMTEYLKKLPVPTKRATAILLEVKSSVHFYMCYWYVFVAIYNQFWDIYFLFGCLSWVHCMYVSKGVRIRVYFSKLKGARQQEILVEAIWNVMAQAQKPDFFFRRNGRVHLNQRGRQFSLLLAAELCASAIVMLDTPCSEVVWRVLATHSIRQFPLHFPCRASSCAIKFQLESKQ